MVQITGSPSQLLIANPVGGGAIFSFGTKFGLKSTKNVVFCILFRPMGGLKPPLWLHYFPKRHPKVGDPPGIVAQFISRNLLNEIYSKRAVVKSVDEKDFPLQKTERKKLFSSKNLTQARKRLLRLTKQKAKAKGLQT